MDVGKLIPDYSTILFPPFIILMTIVLIGARYTNQERKCSRCKKPAEESNWLPRADFDVDLWLDKHAIIED
jgi:hypothetical protein